MGSYDRYYHRMPDGTVKQINPFNQTEVWSVSERGYKAFFPNGQDKEPLREPLREPEDYCHFCEKNWEYVTPQKARHFFDGKEWKTEYCLLPHQVKEKRGVHFRRVGNLFEIVGYNYWRKNYQYQMKDHIRKWRDAYLSDAEGMRHVMNVLALKYEKLGIHMDEWSFEEKLDRIDAFFGGCHELILGLRHYKPHAQYTTDLFSAGDFTPEEHFQYMMFTIDTMRSLKDQNPFLRYISIFQNWLKPAGASFDHLHKQLVGLDEWGVQLEREIREVMKNPNIYNEFGVNFAIYNSFLLLENEFAIGYVEIGHRYPTIAVYSKSREGTPLQQTPQEIRGMSDLVHAVHVALTSEITCNEEWYYTPFDSLYILPWRVLIKLRFNVPAGFEGNTKIYINPISPEQLTEIMIERLLKARESNLFASGIRIGSEVSMQPNPLLYSRR
ncbi:MAG: DUF4921 family protein [Brevinematales bacterium]|nr:DUF4921 family protein [Brevinematales bacterium]